MTNRLQSVRVRSALVPLDPPIQTSSAEVPAAPLVLLDLETEDGVVGRSSVFCYTPLVLAPLGLLLRDLCAALADTPLTPAAVRTTVEARFRLLRPQGLVTMAASAIDIAVWDALARTADVGRGADRRRGLRRPRPHPRRVGCADPARGELVGRPGDDRRDRRGRVGPGHGRHLPHRRRLGVDGRCVRDGAVTASHRPGAGVE